MKAIHLAAGQGTRLRPLTNDKPKPLVELDGKSLLERNVETLRRAGVDDQLVITGYKAERIEELGYETIRNEEYATTEMVYSLFSAVESFPTDSDLVISYGDILYDESVVEALLEADAPLSVVVDREWQELWNRRFERPLSDAETLRTNNSRIVQIGSKPSGYDDIEAQYIGLVRVRKDYVGRFESAYDALDQESIQMTSFIQHLINEGWHIEPVAIDARWLEVDTLADLELYRELLESDDPIEHVSFLR
jgi:choline kinase